ncbi:MAG: OmpH family outer membrane protein [Candidatus Sericytochromatia bacterium]
MKKYILGALASALILLPSTQAFAADVQIGVVDVQTIVAKSQLYSAVRKAEDEVANMEKNLQKDYMDRVNKLQQAQQQNKPRAEIEKLMKQYEAEIMSKRQKALKEVDSKRNKLQSLKSSLKVKLEKAIKDIASKKKLTHVVDKQAMFLGGIDITSDVLAKVR